MLFQGLTIMLDCGIHPGRTGENSLPYFDNGPEASEVCKHAVHDPQAFSQPPGSLPITCVLCC